MEKTMRDIGSELFNTATEHLIYRLLIRGEQKGYAIAVFRLPQNGNLCALADFSFTPEQGPFELSRDKKGFVLSPFLHKKEKYFFIKADLLIDLNSGTIEYDPLHDRQALEFLEEVARDEKDTPAGMEPLLQDVTTPDEDHYVRITGEAISRIEKGEFKKVVLARKKSFTLNGEVHPADIFTGLCRTQPDSFVSLVKTPGSAYWVGASPEMLVSVSKEDVFHTVALAGTQRAQEEEISKAVWTQKEIEEQALVCRYIINCFKKIRLRDYEEDGPRTVKAGNLFHLKTDYRVRMRESGFPDLGNVMLQLLHPTSAVCGMPREEALDFINRFEKLDRKFYSGYLGPVNIGEETHLFVNIRCAEISGKQITLYSGAGITAGSDPEKELLETELKMQVLQGLITGNRR